jgi:hypothetical protein
MIKIAAKQSKEPFGAINILTDVVLLGLLMFSAIRYFAGSISGSIDLGFLSLKLAPSSTQDFVVLLVLIVWTPLCWLFCMRGYTELDPFRPRRSIGGSDD